MEVASRRGGRRKGRLNGGGRGVGKAVAGRGGGEEGQRMVRGRTMGLERLSMVGLRGCCNGVRICLEDFVGQFSLI